MCGRFVATRNRRILERWLEAVTPKDSDLPTEPSWNVAPTDTVPVALERSAEDGGQRELHGARWGLIPPWAKDMSQSAQMINARIETIQEKSAFKSLIGSRRCVVLGDGYYEWQKRSTGKQPYFIHPRADELVAFAGVYSWWKNAEIPSGQPGRWVLTTSILTTSAVGEFAEIHDRMPVTLSRDRLSDWLRPGGSRDLSGLLGEVQAEAAENVTAWEARPVGKAVGSVRNNSPELIEAV